MNDSRRSATPHAPWRPLVAAATLALALTACGANDPAPAASSASDTSAFEQGGTLTILTSATDINWDPAKSQNLATTTLGLVERRLTTWAVQPGEPAAFAPELSGGLGYHKSLLVGGDDYAGPYNGADLTSIETPDDSTIVFHLVSAYGDWPWICLLY